MKTRRERVKEATIREIKEIAWEQISARGTGGLSVNGIAREMGMTPPAFYRYYAGRDALLQELIRDSLISFHRELEKAREKVSEKALAEQIFCVYTAWRQWAVTNSVAFRLFTELDVWNDISFCEAIKAYHEKVYSLFNTLFLQAWEEGLISIPEDLSDFQPEYSDQLSKLRGERGIDAPIELIHIVFSLWGLAHGLISLEVKGRFSDIISTPKHLFEYQIRRELERIGLVPDR